MTPQELTDHLNSLPPEHRLQPVWVHPSIVPHLVNAFGQNNHVIPHPGINVSHNTGDVNSTMSTGHSVGGISAATLANPPASLGSTVTNSGGIEASGGDPVRTAPPSETGSVPGAGNAQPYYNPFTDPDPGTSSGSDTTTTASTTGQTGNVSGATIPNTTTEQPWGENLMQALMGMGSAGMFPGATGGGGGGPGLQPWAKEL